MSHLSDKELDRLSREAAEQFDVEGSTSGWDALEKKLDESMPAETPLKRRRGLWYWLAGSLLLIGLLSYFIFIDKDGKSAVDNQYTIAKGQTAKTGTTGLNTEVDKVNSEATSGVKTQLKGNIDNVTGNVDQQPEGNNSKDGKVGDISAGSLSNVSAKNKTRNNKNSGNEKLNPATNISSKEKNNRQDIVGNKIPGVAGNNDPATVGSDNLVIVGNSNPEKELPSEKSETDFIRQPVIPTIQHEHLPININAATHADSMISDLANAAIPERDTSVKSNTIFPFEVGMLVGSDMSNVNFQGSDRIGMNFGIYVGYRINKRWLINTGLIYDKKYYSAKGKDFHPPKGYWTDYVKLDLVAGNCSMWEIPLNVRYDLSLARKGSWFISSGLSTYLIQQEDYDYHYWTNGNFYTRQKGYPSNEKSILGILNFSGGFERNFTPHVSLQIEPYLHIPLNGIGFGNMQMNSFGTNFILKFKSGPAKN